MEEIPSSENSLEYLKGKFAFVTKVKREEDTAWAVTLRAKILDVSTDGQKFKIEYEGNKNLLFDGIIEDGVDILKFTTKSTGDEEIPIIPITEEEAGPLEGGSIGKWKAVGDFYSLGDEELT
jgi:hypothetical protein